VLVADVPELRLSASYPSSLMGPRSATLKGVADSVELRASGILVKGLVGDHAADVGSKDAILIHGYLNADCGVDGRCKVAEKEYQPKDGPVDPRYLTSRTVRGVQYQYVMRNLIQGGLNGITCSGLGYVYYFKSADGFEFDGSEGNCPGGGKALLQAYGGSSKDPVPHLDVRPVCGKVTSPKGQSFTGNFDA